MLCPILELPHFKMVLHCFGIPKWGTHFEMVLHHFGTPSLAPFQNGAAPFWNIYFYILKFGWQWLVQEIFLHLKIWMAMVSTGNAASYTGALPIATFSLAFASVGSKFV